MSTKATRPRRRFFRRQIIGWLALTFVVVLVASALARAQLATALVRFALRRGGIEVSEMSGVEIGWRRMHVGRLVARRIEPDGWLASFESDAIDVEFEPSLLLHGAPALVSVRARSARAELDVARHEHTEKHTPSSWSGLHGLPPIAIEHAELDVRLGPGWTIAARDGVLTARDEAIALDARVTIAQGSGRAHVVLERNALSARGDLAAVDVAELNESIASLARSPTARIPIDAGHADAAVAVTLAIGDSESLAVRARVATHDLRFAGRTFDALSGEVWVDSDHVGARDVFASVGANALGLASFELRRFALDPCNAAAQVTAIGDVDVSDVPSLFPTEFAGAEAPPHRLTAKFEAGGGELGVARGSIDLLDAHVAIESTRIPLAESLLAAVRDPSTRAKLQVEIDDLASLGAIVAPILGYGGDEPWTGQASATLEFEGGRGEVHARGDRVAVGRLTLEECAVDARLDALALSVSALHARSHGAALDAHGKWSLDTGRFDGVELEIGLPRIADWIPELPLAAGATLHARAQGSEARIEQLTIRGPHSSLTLTEPAVIESGPAGIETRLSLSGAGSVVADLGASRAGFRARATFDRLEPQVLIEGLARMRIGSIDGTIEARSIDGELSGEASIDVRDLAYADSKDACVLHLEASASESRISVRELSLSCTGGMHAEVQGELPIAIAGDAPLDLQGSLEVPDLALLTTATHLKGHLRSRFQVRGTVEDPQAEVALSGEDLGWRRIDDAAEIGPFAFAGRADIGADACLRELVLAMPNGAQATISGCLTDVPNPLAWLRDEAELAGHAQWNLAAAIDGLDLAPLSAVVPGLRRIGGVARGSLTLRGTFEAPEIRGELTLAQGELRTATSFPTIRGIDTRLSFDGDTVSIDEIRGELGGAPFRLSGSFALWGDSPKIALALEGDNLLLYRSGGVTVRGDAKLKVDGPLHELVLSGDLALAEARMTREIEIGSLSGDGPRGLSGGFVPFSLREAVLSTMRFDVRLTSRTPFRIATSRIVGGLRPDVVLHGTGELPELVGTVDVDETRISLPSGTFWIRNGRIEFVPGDPFRPHLELAGDTRMQGYDIRIRIHGTSEAPIVDLTSIPPLSREDLMLLVLTGRSPGQPITTATGERAAADIAVFFAHDVLRGVLGENPGDEHGLSDRLEVYTGQDVTRKGADTWLARFRIGRGVIARNDTLYLTGERDAYDRYNYGLRVVFRFP